MMGSTQIIGSAIAVLFPAVMIFAGVMDLLTYKIRNTLVMSVAVLFLIAALLFGMGVYEILFSLAAGCLVLVVSFGLFAAGWIGGGDAKFAAATALWFGWDHVLIYLLYSSIIGGLLTVLIVLFRSMMMPASFYGHEWLVKLHESKTGVPYGVAFAIAALIVFPETAWFQA